MKKAIVLVAVLVLLAPGTSRGAPARRAFLRAMHQSCKRCGDYLTMLHQLLGNRAAARKVFLARRRLYFPGAKTTKEAAELVVPAIKVMSAWYRYLANGTPPANAAFLRKFAADQRVSGSFRSTADWLLYLNSHRVHRAACALRMHPFEARIFEHAKDPQFGAILARLVAGALAAPAVPHSAAMALRLSYANFAGAAYFQGIGKGLRLALFGLYGRLRPDARSAATFTKGDFASLTLFPFSPARVVKHLRKYGDAAVLEFLESLARQGLIRDLSEIERSTPTLKPLVNMAVQRRLLEIKSERRALKAFLLHPLRASNPLAGKHPPEVFRPAGTLAAGQPSPPPAWLSVKNPAMTVGVKPGQGFARAVFKLVNTSASPLRIVRVWTSCTCTTATTSTWVIKPGASAMINGRMRLAGLPLPVTRFVYVKVQAVGRVGARHVFRLKMTAR